MANVINWFEIPVNDMKRAAKFYGEIFNTELTIMSMGPHEMAFLPADDQESVSGSLCSGPDYMPSSEGTLIYLNANPDLNVMLKRVSDAGGVVMLPKRQITPEYGYMAIFLDSEGNKIALHSME